MDFTQLLPAEILGHCFELGHSGDSFAASSALGVSRRWRKLAIDSPLYWRHLVVEFTRSETRTLARVHTLGARLQNSRADGAVFVRIYSRTSRVVEEPTEQVLLYVGLHMSRIKRLSMLGVPFSVMKTSQAIFSKAAPQLESLELVFTYSSDDGYNPLEDPVIPEFPLWADMFSGNAPHLQRLLFRNIRIETTSWPLGGQIKELYWQECLAEALMYDDDAIPAPLVLFPNLQVLWVTSFDALPDPLPDLSHICEFTADGHSEHHARWTALASATRARVRNPSADIAKQVMDHLWHDNPQDLRNHSAPQSFRLKLGHGRTEYEMQITVTETGDRRFIQRTRTFDFNTPVEISDENELVPLGPLLSSPRVLLGDTRLANAVVSLQLHWEKLLALIDMAAVMPRLESSFLDLPSYKITEDVLMMELPPGRQLRYPNLREVVTRGWSGMRLLGDFNPSHIVPQENVRHRIAQTFSTEVQRIIFT